jgi:hypothetical protein
MVDRYRFTELTAKLGATHRAGDMRVATYGDEHFTEDAAKEQFARWICGCAAVAHIGPDPRWQLRPCAEHSAL